MQESNVTVVRNSGRDRAVVFVHGFTGTRDDTWDRFPLLFGSATPDWDIFTIGYATSLLPDIVGVWAADPDIPIVSTMLRGHLGLLPLQRYTSVSLVAHSMGGLVVQQALVEDAALAGRVRHVVLFGTPSAGLRKASWATFWKRQLRNMAEGSPFITRLRSEWTRMYGEAAPFVLVAVAGDRDQFVPPVSSLEPFTKACQHVVPGDHLSMVKPATPEAPSVQLLLTTLAADAAPARDSAGELRLAVERPNAAAARIVGTLEAGAGSLSVREVVDAALALEQSGKRDEAVALLERHQDRDTDIKGALAGRIKRMWLESEEPQLAARALRLYQDALNAATSSDQIYYHAINVAFMRFTFLNDPKGARDMAAVAFEHASPPDGDLWKVATVAEAHLYFDRIDEALAGYRALLRLEAEPWKHQSASLQAGRIAARRGDRALAEALEAIFTPGARCVNHIVVSYSGSDRAWFERLQKMLSPYLRSAEGELVGWDDRARAAGGPWDLVVRQVLPRAGVVIALVGPDWLASDVVMTQELPLLVQAARESGLQLLWVSVSAAIWEDTPLADPEVFHPAHDPNAPLDLLPAGEQNMALKSIARQAKEAALGAVTRFQQQPAAEPAVA